HWTLQVVPEIKGTLTDHPNQYGIYLFSEDEMEQETAEQRLSRRELEICELVIKGYTNEQIARELWISINTVKKHLRNIYEKLNVANRTSLAYKLTAIFDYIHLIR
ncbi:response regulator transcription factor, partial [Aneurinibacillus aneurinilyticus]|uniref:response regulator transcription factor n=1 Tax=Aneurinibacillus aneurinilyticus TaxID=1391 RepID=UPI003525D482